MTTDLPNPPWRVYANSPSIGAHWFLWYPQIKAWYYFTGGVYLYCHNDLVPIDDHRNDPEAVEIIRRAKEEK